VVGTLSIEKARREHLLGKTRAEVAKKLTRALEAHDKGTLVTGPRQTVGQFFAQWLDAVRPSLRPRTFVRYEQLVRLHVRPDLGALALTKLSPQHLQRLYTSRLDAGLSSTTVNHLHALIHKALSNAVRWGTVNRNVADLVDPPRNRHFEIATLTAEQTRAFLDTAAGNRLEALFVLAVTTGMRQGELLGLRWRDVDLDVGMLQIRGSMQATPDGLRIMEPKTPDSRRQVALSKQPVEALRRHRVAQAVERLRVGAAWEDNQLVFATASGGPITASELRRSYEPLLKRAGLPRMRFHDLRHTSATLLLGRGVHPKVVSEILGHTRISTTLDLYSHVSMTIQQQATDMFDVILSRAT
jgi:integrase